MNVYRDPLPVKRPVTHVSWSPDQGTRIAVSHCSTDFKKVANYSPISYIWDVGTKHRSNFFVSLIQKFMRTYFLSIAENPNKPFLKLKAGCPLLTLEYNPKDANILVSGLMTGQVAFWDIRRCCEPIDTSLAEYSHRDPCDQVLWINSKTGTEFFSAAKDGQVNLK